MKLEEAVRTFKSCCGSRAWADAMAAARPFADFAAVLKAADAQWKRASPLDWLEATTAHPKIGDLDALARKYSGGGEAAEQGGVQGASSETLQELARLNEAYYKKHGFIFIIYASGKSASEMLEALRDRIDQSTELELARAAEAQGKITRNRLEKLLS